MLLLAPTLVVDFLFRAELQELHIGMRISDCFKTPISTITLQRNSVKDSEMIVLKLHIPKDLINMIYNCKSATMRLRIYFSCGF